MMPHDPAPLAAAIAVLAASGVARGQLWIHHRALDVLYRIVDVVVMEATRAPGVAYARVDGVGPTWVRPMGDFLGSVPYERGDVPRFRQVRDGVAGCP